MCVCVRVPENIRVSGTAHLQDKRRLLQLYSTICPFCAPFLLPPPLPVVPRFALEGPRWIGGGARERPGCRRLMFKSYRTFI